MYIYQYEGCADFASSDERVEEKLYVKGTYDDNNGNFSNEETFKPILSKEYFEK